ncbi:Uncharacterised protein [Klebsiella pneumoniae]|nr:Uncharacterised protein [Klebsiella pneumoniae]
MGQGAVAEISQIQDKSGMFSSAGQVSDTYHVKDKDRITMRELRGMAEGEGVMSLEDRLVRSRAFYIPDEEKNIENPVSQNQPVCRSATADN